MESTREDWETVGRSEFVHVHVIARRLAVVAIQSVDVERVCKAYKIIHTKIRSRLRSVVVQQLLFTYINLRLLNKCNQPMDDFLTAAIRHEQNESEDEELYDDAVYVTDD